MGKGSPGRGPGPVVAVHKLFIGSALLCALVYAAWEARQFARTGAPASALVAALALVAAGGLAVYLHTLRGLGAKLLVHDPPRDA